jgi:hypothetical protein
LLVPPSWRQPPDPDTAGGRVRRTDRELRPRRSASIYGTVVVAAVLASGGNQLTTAAQATVLVTLVIYWLAEQYAELLGQRTY